MWIPVKNGETAPGAYSYVQVRENGVKWFTAGCSNLRMGLKANESGTRISTIWWADNEEAEEKKLNEIAREDVFRSAGLWAGIGPGNRSQ
jgi:hypothetical protein